MPKFVPRQRKHKVRQREESLLKLGNGEPSGQINEGSDRARLRNQLVSGQSKLSSKKKKRLDKYITSKLKKEDTVQLIQQLGKSRIDTSLFTSTKDLGSKVTAKNASLQPQEDPDSDSSYYPTQSERSCDTDGPSTESKASGSDPDRGGQGLKRPLIVDKSGQPLISRKRKRASKPEQSEDESSWNGLGSSDAEPSLSEGDDGSPDFEDQPSSPPSSIFKKWAIAQKNKDAVRDVPGYAEMSAATSDSRARISDSDSLPDDLQQNSPQMAFPSIRKIATGRSSSTEESRLKLPIVAEEQQIMEAIRHNPIVLICGPTGSGKTTQIPQFLFEAGFGNPQGPFAGLIGVTQPRRVAAVSMSKRVGQELGDIDRVAHQIRYQGNVQSRTAIKFMTDGILLREVSDDITLQKYSILVIDEAHERNVNTDLLIGILGRVVKLRRTMAEEDPPRATPLRLVIMSATLQLSEFVNNPTIFPETPPVLEIEGREHPVSIHFSSTTPENYLDDVHKKIVKGHKQLPKGAMLVFMTGQQEIRQLINRLTKATGDSEQQIRSVSGMDATIELDDLDLGQQGSKNFGHMEDFDDEFEEDLPYQNDIPDESEPKERRKSQMHVLPLYSLLPIEDQMKVFKPPPDGSRLIVIATNVAETSLTIPGVRYVFDTGRAKQSFFDPVTGIQKYEITWISKASAIQRAGRAGRNGPGHCYRLYSSALFESQFKEHTTPEILAAPLEKVVLQLKSMGLQDVTKFPFPTPPDQDSLRKAERLLHNVGALDATNKVTSIGQRISAFPISPRFARILIIGNQKGCMPYTIALVAGLSVNSVYLTEREVGLLDNDEEVDDDVSLRTLRKEFNAARARLSQLYDDRCDAMKLLATVLSYSEASDKKAFCTSNFVRFKALQEAELLRSQLTAVLRSNGLYHATFEPILRAPTASQVTVLKQLLGVGFIDNIAIRGDLAPEPPERNFKNDASKVYVPLSIACPTVDEAAYLDTMSVLSPLPPPRRPRYIFYSHLRTVKKHDGTDRLLVFPLTPVKELQLRELAIGTPLLHWGKPVHGMPLKRDSDGEGEKMECWVTVSLRGSAGALGWPLPQKKVVMRKRSGQGYVVVED